MEETFRLYMPAQSLCCVRLLLLVTPWTVASIVHRMFQAGILEWVVISYTRGSSWLRDQTCVSCIGRRILLYRTTWEACH